MVAISNVSKFLTKEQSIGFILFINSYKALYVAIKSGEKPSILFVQCKDKFCWQKVTELSCLSIDYYCSIFIYCWNYKGNGYLLHKENLTKKNTENDMQQ